MKGVLNILSLGILFLGNAFHTQTKQSDYTPYTIETTYHELKKNYDFITPIAPLISKTIVYKEDVVYKKTEHSELALDIYIPKGKKNETYPAVLLIHGGGWLVGSKTNQRVMAQHLANNGYVAITVAYRLGFEAVYPAGVIDLKDAIRWLRNRANTYDINPNKMAVLGASAGAQLATLIGVTPNSSIYGFDPEVSDQVQAIINIDGIVSFIHSEASSEGKMAGVWLSGLKHENFKNWKEASPLEYVDANTPPTLCINSSKARFHAGRDDMIAILNAHDIYNETHELPDSPHSFWLMHPWFETTLEYTLLFLDKVF